jgi:hypothetical protein
VNRRLAFDEGEELSSESDDPLPLLRAQFDQALAMALEVARVARGLYDAFKAAGFSDAEGGVPRGRADQRLAGISAQMTRVAFDEGER